MSKQYKTRITIMKRSIKITVTSLLVLGSSQVYATEMDLDVTDIITKSVTNYVKKTGDELNKSIKENLLLDAKAILNRLLDESKLAENDIENNSKNTALQSK
jgi:hypothetical protein